MLKVFETLLWTAITTPFTGDTNPLYLWLALTAGTALVLIAGVVLLFRNRSSTTSGGAGAWKMHGKKTTRRAMTPAAVENSIDVSLDGKPEPLPDADAGQRRLQPVRSEGYADRGGAGW